MRGPLHAHLFQMISKFLQAMVPNAPEECLNGYLQLLRAAEDGSWNFHTRKCRSYGPQ